MEYCAGAFPTQNILFLAPTDAHIEADHAILVSRADHRDIAREIVLSPDDLLRTLRDIGAIAEREVVGELLLDGDLRSASGWVGFGGESLRVDLDAADSKQALHAAGGGGVQRLVQNQGGSVTGKLRLTGFLLQLL